MISISDKTKCCGCSACAQRCPKHCISMLEDSEGFLYPVVKIDDCINCGICERVCPIINQGSERVPVRCYAAKGKDEIIVNKSSSAGVFSLLADKIIKRGGVVFGAQFNQYWDVVHSHTETLDGIDPFRGSKYVQSRIGSSFQEVETYLKQGRYVLFTGTPCQIAGLKRFLGKEYENLIAVDVVCHGTPSPIVFRSYLRSVLGLKPSIEVLSEKEAARITSFFFRDKHLSWEQYCVNIIGLSNAGNQTTLVNEKYTEDPYMQAFLFNYMLRPSCYNCPARKGKSGSDLLIGDFWGISRIYPDFYSPKGVSLSLVYSEKGLSLFDDLDLCKMAVSYEDTKGNRNIEFNEIRPHEREAFFINFSKFGIRAIKWYNWFFKHSTIHRVLRRFTRWFN